MKRYASCYCRYSTDKQQQQSIEYQLERIEDFCKKHNITLVEKYIDEATSGTSDNRKAFQAMIEDSEQSEWGYLIVYNLSRLARNVEDQLYYQKILKQRGIMIISVEEKFDSTPEGHLFSLITAGINEYYSKHLAKRSFAGVMQNAKKALAIGGIPPLGFDVDKNKHYIINQKEAESVRIIFDKFLEGWTHSEISKYLNEKGYKSKKGAKFNKGFHEILRNRKYIGEYIFNVTTKKKSRGKRDERENNEEDIVRIPNGLPQIVDTITFEKAQHLLKKRSNKAKLMFKPSKYLLTGIVECGVCGQKYSGNTSYNKSMKRPYIRYTHPNYAKGGGCKVKDIPVRYLDNWITKVVITDFIRINDIPIRTREINAQIMEERKATQSKIKEIKGKLDEIDNQLTNQANSLVRSSFSMFALEEVAIIKDQQRKIKREKEYLENRLKMLNKVTIEKFTTVVQKVKKQWLEANTLDEKIKAIKWIISKIVITNDEVVAYTNYDTLTKRLCDFDIKIVTINRDRLMLVWRSRG